MWKRQDEVRHIAVRARRWPLPQLSLPKGTGDTKAEEHCVEVLERRTIEMKGDTTGRKTPGKWASQRDWDRCPLVGRGIGSNAVTQKAGGWHWKGWVIRSSRDLAQATQAEQEADSSPFF